VHRVHAMYSVPHRWSPDSSRLLVPVADGDVNLINTDGRLLEHQYPPGSVAGFVDERSVGMIQQLGNHGDEGLEWVVTNLDMSIRDVLPLEVDRTWIDLTWFGRTTVGHVNRVPRWGHHERFNQPRSVGGSRMGRPDGTVAPNRLTRWVATHACVLQIGCAVLALVAAALVVATIRDEGWGASAAIMFLNVIVCACLVVSVRGIARVVAHYEEGNSSNRVH
jgi:hypothetical protein